MKAERKGMQLEVLLDYHARTRHRLPDRYAASLGYLDWASQPDPFLHYEGTARVPLAQVEPTAQPALDALDRAPGPPAPLTAERIGQLLYDALAISAWKQAGGSRWALRANPSSGNLHPTEAYLLLPAVDGIAGEPALHHYSPLYHALELRRRLDPAAFGDWRDAAGPGTFFIALSSIPWREAWKYGERAFRYCQHDVGHALAALAYAAAALGWTVRAVPAAEPDLAALLGIDAERGPEFELAEVLLAVGAARAAQPLGPDLAARLALGPALGRASALSDEHHAWPVLAEVAAASASIGIGPAAVGSKEAAATPAAALEIPAIGRAVPAREVFRRRRSAVAMDGRSRLDLAGFARMLARTLPGRVPFDALPPAPPGIDLLLFVHRVDGLEPGLYLLRRGAGSREAMRAAFDPAFEWKVCATGVDGLDLVRLQRGDARELARLVSCHQEIASAGCFAVSMICPLQGALEARGAAAYRDLHWEAGAIGQVLYLEAEAAGLRATGIGCFFDDAIGEMLGTAAPHPWVPLYHFTVGGAVEDPRLQTLPPYFHLENT
jgi:SagB-type dehydrogenase family enzyme